MTLFQYPKKEKRCQEPYTLWSNSALRFVRSANFFYSGFEHFEWLYSFGWHLLAFLTTSIEIALLSISFRELSDWERQY